MYFIVIYINIGTKRSINKLSYFLWQIHYFQMRNNHEKQIKLLKVYLNDSIKKTLAQNQFRSFELVLKTVQNLQFKERLEFRKAILIVLLKDPHVRLLTLLFSKCPKTLICSKIIQWLSNNSCQCYWPIIFGLIYFKDTYLSFQKLINFSFKKKTCIIFFLKTDNDHS